VARNPPSAARAATTRASLLATCVALGACSTLLDLDGLKRVDCVENCGGIAGQAAGGSLAGTGANAGSQPSGGGSLPTTGGTASAGASAVGGSKATGGGGGAAGGGSSGVGDAPAEAGAAGAGGVGPVGPCPGGVAPPANWQEHWTDHSEALALRDYDDCIAVYVDSGMAGTDTAWLSDFLSKAWTYNLTSYGKLGADRLFVVLHLGKHLGGHAAAFYETTHDGRNVIDAGANSWTLGDYALTAKLLSALVERTAVPGKQGSPASSQWGADGFAEIYSYDLYTGLGMDSAAKQAFDAFTPTAHDYPLANSYWFSDFYYPLWQAHGKTKVLTQFFSLLGQYYPTTNQVMAPMDFGHYIHFLSGAAAHEAQTQATYAFGWNSTWQAQLTQARSDFPAITY